MQTRPPKSARRIPTVASSFTHQRRPHGREQRRPLHRARYPHRPAARHDGFRNARRIAFFWLDYDQGDIEISELYPGEWLKTASTTIVASCYLTTALP